MLKSDMSFRRFLDTFIPGFIVTMFIWYLYKPYINKYFPSIAFNSANPDFPTEVKIIFLLVLSFFIGVLINHFSDIPIALHFPNLRSEKSKRPFKRLALTSFSFISWNHDTDPRVFAIQRYLISDRKSVFLSLMEKWGFTDEISLRNPDEAIIAHQHICTRLKSLNALSEKSFNDCIAEVNFSSALLSSIMTIFPLTLIALILNNVFGWQNPSMLEFKFLENETLIYLLTFEYLLLIVLSYSLKRRFRHFSSQILTLAIHFFEESRRTYNLT